MSHAHKGVEVSFSPATAKRSNGPAQPNGREVLPCGGQGIFIKEKTNFSFYIFISK
jgi:hypothetical protein